MASDSPLHIEQSLKNLGFSKNETKVLIYLFQVKKASTEEVSRNTAITFASVQFSLSSLQRRGLIQVDSNGPDDQYQVCSKEAFDTWITEQREKHDALYEQAELDVGQFFSFVEEHSWQPGVQYYEGVDGIKEIYEDMLQVGQPLYSWIDLEEIENVLGDYMDEFIDRRVEADIMTYAIMPKKLYNTSYDPDGVEKREVRWKSNLPLNGEIRIYGDKVAVMTFDSDKPVGFVFQSALMTKLFKAVFDSQWDS